MEKLTKLPTVAELFEENMNVAFANEQLNTLLNAQPKPSWVKLHPYIKEYRYLPIDKIEFLLRKIFKQYSIEITGQGTAFNGVWVTVRVHYFSPATNKMEFHDGIGACQLQTQKGTSPADLININNGALSMAFPIAKTVAIKDACDHFGNLFGANLNRKDVIEFTPDLEILEATIDLPTISFIESLLLNSSLDENEKQKIEREVCDYNRADADKCIKHLQMHQLNSLTMGSHYNQTQIKNEIAKLK